MKKTLLSLCVMLAAFVGMASAQNALDNNLTGNKRFTVTVSTGEGGSIEISNTSQTSQNNTVSAAIQTGEDVILIISADEGYQLASLTVDGAEVKDQVTDNSYTIKAISKNMPVNATFELIPTPTKVGDVNGDGEVNSADVTAIYSYIGSGEGSGLSITNVDLDGDGKATSADVTRLYSIISAGE